MEVLMVVAMAVVLLAKSGGAGTFGAGYGGVVPNLQVEQEDMLGMALNLYIRASSNGTLGQGGTGDTNSGGGGGGYYGGGGGVSTGSVVAVVEAVILTQH